MEEKTPVRRPTLRVSVAFALVTALVAMALGPATPAGATPGVVRHEFKVPGHATFDLTEAWCDNSGPHITISSSIDLGGHAAQLSFMNNKKGTHTLTVQGTVELNILNAQNGVVQIAKQPPLGGVGGNPFIYFQADGGDPHFLGRCVQNGKIRNNLDQGPFGDDLDVQAFSEIAVQALSCASKGSKLNVNSHSGTGDVNGRIILANNDLGKSPPHINDTDILASVGLTLLSGESIRRGWGVGGTGGNPHIAAETGTLVGDVFASDNNKTYLGRCKDLL